MSQLSSVYSVSIVCSLDVGVLLSGALFETREPLVRCRGVRRQNSNLDSRSMVLIVSDCLLLDFSLSHSFFDFCFFYFLVFSTPRAGKSYHRNIENSETRADERTSFYLG